MTWPSPELHARSCKERPRACELCTRGRRMRRDECGSDRSCRGGPCVCRRGGGHAFASLPAARTLVQKVARRRYAGDRDALGSRVPRAGPPHCDSKELLVSTIWSATSGSAHRAAGARSFRPRRPASPSRTAMPARRSFPGNCCTPLNFSPGLRARSAAAVRGVALSRLGVRLRGDRGREQPHDRDRLVRSTQRN